MKFTAAIVVAVLFACLDHSSSKYIQNVFNFEMRETKTEMFDVIQRMMGRIKQSRMLGFSYNQCPGTSQGTAHIKSLNFQPDPLVFPGELIVSFYIENDMAITSKLAANVTMIRKTSLGNITIPCVDNIGSCNYDDICALINPPACPQPFIDAKIPCKCPFPKGVFDLKKGATFDVLTVLLPPGEYYGRINLNLVGKKTTFVGCYELAVTFG